MGVKDCLVVLHLCFTLANVASEMYLRLITRPHRNFLCCISEIVSYELGWRMQEYIYLQILIFIYLYHACVFFSQNKQYLFIC